MKLCRNCHQVKEFKDFYKRSNRPSLREDCKTCHCEKTTKRLKEKPVSTEQARINAANFRKNNPTYYHGQYKKTKDTNPGALKAQWARKRANRKQAVPKWLTEAQRLEIVKIYSNCPKGYHVDHIIPIAGKSVRGLHVPWNLQYLPALENIRKNNKLESVG